MDTAPGPSFRDRLRRRASKALYDAAFEWRRGQFRGAGTVDHQRCAVIGDPVVTIGRNSYANGLRVYGWGGQHVTIGKFCSIADDTAILAGGHHSVTRVATSSIVNRLGGLPEDESKGNVTIGNDVWIGHGVTILSGVTVGDGAVIAAHSLVRDDVDPYSIVGGTPATKISERFPPAISDQLRGLAWWDWPDEVIAARAVDFESPEVLLNKYGLGADSGS